MKHKRRAVKVVIALGLLVPSLSLLTTAATPAGAVVTATDNLTGFNPLVSVSCPTSTFCVAGDSQGALYLSSSSVWSLPVELDPGSSITALSCATITFCMAGDSNGNTFTYDGANWSLAPSQPDGSEILGVSCVANTDFCMVVTNNGNALTTTNGGLLWIASSLASGFALVSVSCPTTTFCAAVDGAGNAYTWDSGSNAWTMDFRVSLNPLVAVSCPTTSDCNAVDNVGDVFTFNGSSWVASAQNPIESTSATVAITCPTTSFCLLSDAGGDVFAKSNSLWSPDLSNPVDFLGASTAASCSSATSCVLVDDNGFALSYTPLLIPSTLSITNIPTSPTIGTSFVPTITTDSDGTTSVVDTTTSVCSFVGLDLDFLTNGTCDLVANVSATGTYLAATGAVQAITVSSAPRSLLPQDTLNVTTASGVVGTPLTLSTSGGSGAGAVTFTLSSAGSAGCSLVGNTISAAQAGTCSVVAAKASDGTFAVATSSVTLTFIAATTAPPVTTPPSKEPSPHPRRFVIGSFANGSSVLGLKLTQLAANLASTLRRHHDHVVQLSGYASPPGSPSSNQVLSLARARSVGDFLARYCSAHHYRVTISASGKGVLKRANPAMGRVVVAVLR